MSCCALIIPHHWVARHPSDSSKLEQQTCCLDNSVARVAESNLPWHGLRAHDRAFAINGSNNLRKELHLCWKDPSIKEGTSVLMSELHVNDERDGWRLLNCTWAVKRMDDSFRTARERWTGWITPSIQASGCPQKALKLLFSTKAAMSRIFARREERNFTPHKQQKSRKN